MFLIAVAVESRAITFICRFRARDDSRVESREEERHHRPEQKRSKPITVSLSRPSRLILHVRVTNICFPTTTSKERSGGGGDDLPNQTPAGRSLDQHDPPLSKCFQPLQDVSFNIYKSTEQTKYPNPRLCFDAPVLHPVTLPSLSLPLPFCQRKATYG